MTRKLTPDEVDWACRQVINPGCPPHRFAALMRALRQHYGLTDTRAAPAAE